MVPLQSAPPSVPGAVSVAEGSIWGPLSELFAKRQKVGLKLRDLTKSDKHEKSAEVCRELLEESALVVS